LAARASEGLKLVFQQHHMVLAQVFYYARGARGGECKFAFARRQILPQGCPSLSSLNVERENWVHD